MGTQPVMTTKEAARALTENCGAYVGEEDLRQILRSDQRAVKAGGRFIVQAGDLARLFSALQQRGVVPAAAALH